MSLKKIVLLFYFMGLFFALRAQTPPVYNPLADAAADLKEALVQAKKTNKHVFIQIGGNWCSWCMAFNKLTLENDSVKNELNKNFIVLHLNYSKENRNEPILKQLGFPQRFGFPVFVILDSKGERLHTQNSGYLEEGKGHSPKKVVEFLQAWAPLAISPESYIKKK